jgi:SAM-dependent methyltransferase
MERVKTHYERQLAAIYSWMAGGRQAAIANNRQLLQQLAIESVTKGLAIDLGAGSGFQSIPLAELGFSVMAIDFCAVLLSELRENSQGLAIAIIEDDLLNFTQHISEPAQIVVCMGDTITHLPSLETVEALLSDIAMNLGDRGKLILTFRDYVTSELKGVQRFIPVRNDDSRIFTCFLEYQEQYLEVHDLLYQQEFGRWSMQVSSYRKLRLAPNWVKNCLEAKNLTIVRDELINGMVCLVASKD